MTPFIPIGKEIERRAQEGEDISILENKGPRRYQPSQTAKTRPADPGLILRAKRLLQDGEVSHRRFMHIAKVSQHSFERFLHSECVFPKTRARLEPRWRNWSGNVKTECRDPSLRISAKDKPLSSPAK
jgi:hypothetical protein